MSILQYRNDNFSLYHISSFISISYNFLAKIINLTYKPCGYKGNEGMFLLIIRLHYD